MVSASAAIETAGGKNQSRRPSTALVLRRNFSAKARASRGPWFIFQLAANTRARSILCLVQGRHARQLLPFEELERSATTGGNMGDPVGQSGLRNGCGRVTSANHCDSALFGCIGHSPCDRHCAMVEG